jgi:hypothetical protein
MPWPTDAAVERALGVGSTGSARSMLTAAGLPELLTLIDVAEVYGVAKQNVDKIAGLPDPVYGPDLDPPYRLRHRLWIADDVRAHAEQRRRAPRVGAVDVSCPTCGAEPWDGCATRGGRPTTNFHTARIRAAHI